MNKKILVGVIFSIFVIIMTSTTTAIEFKTVSDFNNDLINQKLENFYQFFKNLESNSNEIELKNKIKELSTNLDDIRISINDNPSLPSCIRAILGFIIGLLFSIIGTIFGIIFGPLLSFMIRILTAPVVLLAKIIEFIVNLFTPS